MITKSYENKIKRLMSEEGFLKIEGDNFFIYEFDPKLKSNYRLRNRFKGDWNFTIEVIRLERRESWERLKIIKTYPCLKKYFFEDNKKFVKLWKIEMLKRQLERRGTTGWDTINILTGERTYAKLKGGRAEAYFTKEFFNINRISPTLLTLV